MLRTILVVGLLVVAFVFGSLVASPRAQYTQPQVFMDGGAHAYAYVYWPGLGKVYVYYENGECWKSLAISPDAGAPIKVGPCK